MTRQYEWLGNWLDQGTGPFPTATESGSTATSFLWRDKPEEKWTARTMPDDALDPGSLVGRMLRPEPATDPLMDGVTLLMQSDDRPLPLWRVMQNDYGSAVTLGVGWAFAAEIEALRDWLLPEEAEPLEPRPDASFARWHERQRLRALLTEQARIAREGQ